MRTALAVIGVILVLGLFGTMMVGIKGAQTTEREDSFNAVVTAPAATTADVVLVTDPFENDILNVSIVSDNEDDAPLPDSYIAATNTLTIRGLIDDDTRDLTVTYVYGSLTGSAAPTGSFLKILPLLVGVTAVLILIGAGIAALAHRNT